MSKTQAETGIDWEDSFNNGDHIPGGDGFPAIWEQRAHAFRDAWQDKETGIAYGDEPREKLDLFRPKGAAKGLVVFVHGGYWMKMDRSLWSDLAEGPLTHGWAVAMPSYTLAPSAKISEITRQIGVAICKAAELVAGPIRLTGHSAGGHLVSRMVCTDTPLPKPIIARLANVISLSGVHDLRPLRLHSMNQTLGLDHAEAVAESSVLKEMLPDVPFSCWTGALERPEFLRQAQLLSEAWAGSNAVRPAVYEPNRHHFDVVDGLKDPEHPLTRALLL